MGSSQSKEAPVAVSDFPPYTLKFMSPQHIIVGGGGGAAKTGVKNSLSIFNLQPQLVGDTTKCKFVLTGTVDTGLCATMNLAIQVPNPSSTEVLIACGQDNVCRIYRANWTVSNDSSESETSGGSSTNKNPKLEGKSNPQTQQIQESRMAANSSGQTRRMSLDVQEALAVRTDFNEKKDSYQNVVKFAPILENNTQLKFLFATGGTDGHLRLWTGGGKKFLECRAHTTEIVDMDLSHDGALAVTVGDDKRAILWNLEANGTKVGDIVFQPPDNSPHPYRIRMCRFTPFGRRTTVFLTASIPIQRSSKGQRSFLSLYSYNSNTGNILCIMSVLACPDVISALALSDDASLTAVGTRAGSVYIYETEDLKLLRAIPHTHQIFVTGVEFLPSMELGPSSAAYGISEDYRSGVVSISADSTIRVHYLPWSESKGFLQFLMKTFLWLLVIYLFLWLIGFTVDEEDEELISAPEFVSPA